MLVRHVPSPVRGAVAKVEHTYTGPLETPLGTDMLACQVDSPHLMAHVTKLYPDEDAVSSFRAFGRILSGRLVAGQEVRVLGESYSLADEEDSRPATVGRLWVLCARLVGFTFLCF